MLMANICRIFIKTVTKEALVCYIGDNVHTGKVGNQASGSRFLTLYSVYFDLSVIAIVSVCITEKLNFDFRKRSQAACIIIVSAY